MSDYERFRGCRECGLELPILVLAIYEPSPDVPEDYRLNAEWAGRLGLEGLLPLRHQTAGVGCHQHYMWVIPLKPRPEVEVAMYRLEKHWYAQDTGALGVPLDELVEYRGQLRDWLHVDCNWTYRYFEEGIYPVDGTPEHIKRLTEQELPEDFDELLEWTRPDDPEDPQERERRVAMRHLMGFIFRWKLFILGENSD